MLLSKGRYSLTLLSIVQDLVPVFRNGEPFLLLKEDIRRTGFYRTITVTI